MDPTHEGVFGLDPTLCSEKHIYIYIYIIYYIIYYIYCVLYIYILYILSINELPQEPLQLLTNTQDYQRSKKRLSKLA